jgi:hypothetical protein
MAGGIVIVADHDGTLESAAVREALTDLDVSESSPVTADAPQVGPGVSDSTVTLTISGHGGDFTKKSQTALTDAVKSIDAVDPETVTVEDGGYTPDE